MILAWLDWQPRVSLPLWLALALVLMIVWGIYLWRCGGSIPKGRRVWTLGLMLVAGFVPLMLLLNPTWVEALPPPEGRPLVTVLVDTSGSMNVADDENSSETRLSRAAELAKQTLAGFSETFETRIIAFDTDARGASSDDLDSITPGLRTDIAAAIGLAADSDRPRGQAVILLSDGIHNAGAASGAVIAARAAKGRGAAIFPISVGKPLTVQNLAVETTAASRLTFVDQPVQLTAEITSRGYDDAPLEVQLLLDGEVIETQSVTLEKNQTSEVAFRVNPPKTGLYRYSIALASMPTEATSEDNSASLLVRVVDSPIGVLLLEGKPYWDSKFLARNLARDPSVQLESLVMMRANRFLHRRQSFQQTEDSPGEAGPQNQQQTPPWQILESPDAVIGSADSLKKYQVIVLGRDAEAYLDDTTLGRLRNWVSTQGGSLVCARGAPQSTLSEKLGRMLPVRWTRGTEQRYRAQLTEASQREGWLVGRSGADPLASMPSLVTDTAPEKRGGLPRVLVSGGDGPDSVPIVTYQPYGAGRTVVVEGTGMWRWALLPPEFAASDSTYPSVWNGLLQWLVSRVALTPGQDRALQSDRTRFSTDAPASATLLVRETVSTESAPVVMLTRDGDEQATKVVCEPAGDQPGVYQARFGPLAAGNYRAVLLEAGENDRSVTAFEVRQPIAESLDLEPREDLLAAIAQESGGQVLSGVDGEQIAETVEQRITSGLQVETRKTPVWDRWWVLAGIIGMWTATWTLRRRSGLI
ncbi:MAG: VWA domain-containing protein [Pirellulales bacterium]|nr:VWA domain-containing protein [Pirellulales bacterium]